MDSTGPQGAASPKPQASDDPTNADFVAKEKYQKLKRRFHALREVSHAFNSKLLPTPRARSKFLQASFRKLLARLVPTDLLFLN